MFPCLLFTLLKGQSGRTLMTTESTSAAAATKKAAPAPAALLSPTDQALADLDDAEPNEPTEAFCLDTKAAAGAAATQGGRRLADDVPGDTLALDERQLSASAEKVAATVVPTSPAKTAVIGDYKL